MHRLLYVGNRGISLLRVGAHTPTHYQSIVVREKQTDECAYGVDVGTAVSGTALYLLGCGISGGVADIALRELIFVGETYI